MGGAWAPKKRGPRGTPPKKKLFALGYTLVPLNIHYNSNGFAKVQIGISKGRKKEDKRQYKKEQDWKREKSKIFKTQNF